MQAGVTQVTGSPVPLATPRAATAAGAVAARARRGRGPARRPGPTRHRRLRDRARRPPRPRGGRQRRRGRPRRRPPRRRRARRRRRGRRRQGPRRPGRRPPPPPQPAAAQVEGRSCSGGRVEVRLEAGRLSLHRVVPAAGTAVEVDERGPERVRVELDAVRRRRAGLPGAGGAGRRPGVVARGGGPMTSVQTAGAPRQRTAAEEQARAVRLAARREAAERLLVAPPPLEGLGAGRSSDVRGEVLRPSRSRPVVRWSLTVDPGRRRAAPAHRHRQGLPARRRRRAAPPAAGPARRRASTAGSPSRRRTATTPHAPCSCSPRRRRSPCTTCWASPRRCPRRGSRASGSPGATPSPDELVPPLPGRPRRRAHGPPARRPAGGAGRPDTRAGPAVRRRRCERLDPARRCSRTATTSPRTCTSAAAASSSSTSTGRRWRRPRATSARSSCRPGP